MKNLLIKELRLSTIPLTYIFLTFALMTFIPGYPILCGAFFFCLGLFQSYQSSREANDILYSVLLPVAKRDVVKAKYLVAAVLEMAMFVLCAVCTIIRMAFLSDAGVYEANALMAANLVYLAFILLIFAAFNFFFIGGFFKTAYGVGKPFIVFIVVIICLFLSIVFSFCFLFLVLYNISFKNHERIFLINQYHRWNCLRCKSNFLLRCRLSGRIALCFYVSCKRYIVKHTSGQSLSLHFIWIIRWIHSFILPMLHRYQSNNLAFQTCSIP